MGDNKFINNNTEESDNSGIHSEYSDHIYVGESKSKEVLYDRNNPIVRIILLVLGSVAVLGTIYYIIQAMSTM